MKGLVLYDLYKFKGAYAKNLIFVAALYTAMTFVMRIEFLLYMMIWMMGFYAIGAISMDAGWNLFVRALPVGERQLATAKFLSTGMMMLVGVVYAMIVGGAVCMMTGGSYWGYLQVVLMVTLISVITMSIMLPSALKWGVEKARNTLLLIFAAFFGGALVLKQGLNVDVDLSWLDAHLEWGLLIVAVAAVLVCVLGWTATVRVYKGKES